VFKIISRQPLYFAVVLVPFLVLLVYFGLIASDGYLSRSQLIVERDAQSAAAGLDIGAFGLTGNAAQTDALLIKEFILSRAMHQYLESTLQWRQHYQSDSLDWVSRLSVRDSEEDAYEYFTDHVKVQVDAESSVIDLDVAAYEPAMAKKFTDAIVKRSEEFVNEIARQMAREQMAFVQSEVDQAAKRMQEASDELIRLQREYKIFSPAAESESASRIVAELQAELAKQRTEIKALSAYLSSAAPDLIVAKKRMAAIEQQIAQERKRQVGGNEDGVNDLMLRYQAAQLDAQLTADLYQAGLKSLEMIRIDASRKRKYLIRIAAPNLPDEAELPYRARYLLAAFVFLNLGYFLANLVVAVIKDHRD